MTPGAAPEATPDDRTGGGAGREALVVGASGIVGQAAARRLVADGWTTRGLTRSGTSVVDGVRPVRADLTDAASLRAALADVAPELVVLTAWTRQETEEENIRVNGGAVRDLLAALSPGGSVRHVSLMTGLKHYLGPFEAYGRGEVPDTPFREELERLPHPNFYYAQEDELVAAAARDASTWSVHRSHTVLGHATGNAMNMVATLCAQAALCRHQGRPMVFPGSTTQWDGLTDVSDADLVAEQMTWAASTPTAHDQAFNVVNGDVFRWRWLWPQLAAHLGVDWEGPGEVPQPLEEQMAGAEPLWRELVERHGLVEPDLARVASWWHTDADLGREVEVVTDMNKSRAAGFTATRDTRATLLAHVDRYREERIVP